MGLPGSSEKPTGEYSGQVFATNNPSDDGQILVANGDGTVTWQDAPSIVAPALASHSIASGTALLVDATADRNVALTYSSASGAGTVVVALSPDGTSFTTILSLATAAGAGNTDGVVVPVPAGWSIKATATTATLGATVEFW